MHPKALYFVGVLFFFTIVVWITVQLSPNDLTDLIDFKAQLNIGSGRGISTQIKEIIGTGPLSFVREKGIVDTLDGLELDAMTDEEIVMTIHSNVDNINELCRRKLRMGKIGDGGWEICDDHDVRPRQPCIIYSFGINYDFSFDDDAAKIYGCHVYSFDPSMSQLGDHFERSSKVHFYKQGIDGSTYVNNKGWSLLTLQDIRIKLGHNSSTIDVIKMDVEEAEWNALPQMLKTNQLANVRQILVEYHINQENRNYLLPKLRTIQQLEKTGFKKFYVHKNPACEKKVTGMPMARTNCYEIHYLRR